MWIVAPIQWNPIWHFFALSLLHLKKTIVKIAKRWYENISSVVKVSFFFIIILMLRLCDASWGFLELPKTSWSFWTLQMLHSASYCFTLLVDSSFLLYKLYRISDDLLIQRNKRVKAQPRPFYSSELVNRLKSYTTCSKK